jgi:hypothetical protein
LPATATVWAWAFLFIPFLVGYGLALPAIVMLGLAWSLLRTRERVVFVTLVVAVAAIPVVAGLMERLSGPLRESEAPFYGVAGLEHEPWDAHRQATLAELATRHPGNGFIEFGLAWVAQRGGDHATAEAAYRRAIETWPRDDHALNNLGNLLATQGRFDDALELYQRAIAAAPTNAAPHYNASQVHTRRFDYHAATEALSRANALDFDLVKSYQDLTVRDGTLSLVDQWLSPRRFWEAMLGGPLPSFSTTALPPAWRGTLETRGWPMSVMAVVAGAGAAVLGAWLFSRLPLRTCSNCGSTVCRRCSRRRKETALCPPCAAAAARAESPDFERVLLGQVRRRIERRDRIVRTAAAALVPCLGLVSLRQVFGPVMLLFLGVGAVVALQGLAPPFAFLPRLADPGPGAPMELAYGIGVLVWGVSILGYLAGAARVAADERAAMRNRALDEGPPSMRAA